jgi:carboxypeptidase Q
MFRRLALVVLSACQAPSYLAAGTPAWVTDTGSFAAPAPAPRSPIAARYGDVATRIIAAARADRGAYEKLAQLTDRIGPRLSGSAALERAVAWATQVLRDDGHAARAERVMVPHWQRGAEHAALTAPFQRPLRSLGLGGSVATPKAGRAAPVVVVNNFDELDARTYFDVHHSEADTLDKVDPAQLADGVAAIAVLAYLAAELE